MSLVQLLRAVCYKHIWTLAELSTQDSSLWRLQRPQAFFFFFYQKAALSPGYSAWNNLALFDISDIEVGWGWCWGCLHFERQMWAQWESQPLHHQVKSLMNTELWSCPSTGCGMTSLLCVRPPPCPLMLVVSYKVHLYIRYVSFMVVRCPVNSYLFLSVWDTIA